MIPSFLPGLLTLLEDIFNSLKWQCVITAKKKIKSIVLSQFRELNTQRTSQRMSALKRVTADVVARSREGGIKLHLIHRKMLQRIPVKVGSEGDKFFQENTLSCVAEWRVEVLTLLTQTAGAWDNTEPPLLDLGRAALK